ncbi:hypothetical protein F5Y01DRAFT_326723, partial [Xylaria sp. FL0043]
YLLPRVCLVHPAETSRAGPGTSSRRLDNFAGLFLSTTKVSWPSNIAVSCGRPASSLFPPAKRPGIAQTGALGLASARLPRRPNRAARPCRRAAILTFEAILGALAPMVMMAPSPRELTITNRPLGLVQDARCLLFRRSAKDLLPPSPSCSLFPSILDLHSSYLFSFSLLLLVIGLALVVHLVRVQLALCSRDRLLCPVSNLSLLHIHCPLGSRTALLLSWIN